MKAAVCYEFGKPMVIEDLDIDPPKKGEVKIRLAATAICHSDLSVLKGDFPDTLPSVGGHESAGYVEEVGENVTALKPGDAVVVSLLRSCKQCKYCVIGRPYLCSGKFALDTEKRVHNKRGQAISMGGRVGGFAEYCVVHETQAVPIPSDMPLDRASLLACAVLAGFMGVTNSAQVKAMDSVAIIGCGGVGLNAIQGAAYSGAYPIIAIDVVDSKLEAARVFGATHTINAKQNDIVKTVQELTSGQGTDWVFVTVGSGAAMTQGVQMSSPCGTTVAIGLPPKTETISVSAFDLAILKERSIKAAFMGSPRSSVDIPRLVTLYKTGRLKLDELISGRYSLDQINRAVEDMEGGKALRNVIIFDR
jgi:S-(hydroxymethyl)glutathione dehydrogenase/alcohol dehydrogenase